MKKRSDNRYRRKVTLPNGEVKYVYGKTQKEANDKRDKLKLMYALGATNIDRRITVEKWAVIWWETKKEGKTGRSSQDGYISAMNNYIFPAIGNKKLIDVRLIHIQETINQMGKDGKSESLQRKVLITLNAMFKYALLNGLLTGNPAEFAEIYSVAAETIQALTPGQITEITTLCRDWPRSKYSTRADRAELAVHMGMYLGLRRGEIIAAQWTDLNEANRTIQITRSAELTINQPENKDPKSEAGKRIIPVPDHLWSMFSKTQKVSVYIVPSAKGKQMSKQAFRKLIEPVQNKLSFDFTFHQLRHTYATLLEKMSVSPKMCQYLLGHATESTTKRIYTHIQDDYVMTVSKSINNIYNFSQKSSQGVKRGSNEETSAQQTRRDD